jgi:hypothetical protein
VQDFEDGHCEFDSHSSPLSTIPFPQECVDAAAVAVALVVPKEVWLMHKHEELHLP